MNKKSVTILGISIWKLFAYFIIYSFIGYIIETLFGIATKGVWESRQSFLYGPFCGIYGIGAITITLLSRYFNKNKLTLFVGGFLVGSVTEYTISIKKLKLIILIVIIFLAIDCIATCYAQKQFVNRMIVENDIEVENKEKVIENYNKTYNNKVLSDFINTFWNDKKMIRTFPNIKIEDKEYNTVYIDSLLPNIQPYYKKIF